MTAVSTSAGGVDRFRLVVAAAGGWSVALAGIAVAWTIAGRGYPFGPDRDPSAVLSAIGGLPAAVGAPIAVAIGLVGAVVAFSTWRRPERRGLTLVAWALAAILILAVPDYRLLVIVAYTPLFLIGLPFGFIPVSSYVAAFTPAVLAQVFAVVGGLLWAAIALRGTRAFRSREQAARWGRRATAVAVVIPLLYAATRWGWALGFPLGVSDELFRYGRETGLWTVGAGLATLAVVGALVTLGLVMPWGERWPGWMPGIGGRRVPVALVVVPASIVAVLVTSAGLMFVRLLVTGTFEQVFSPLRGIEGSWAALAPELLWPIWGPALAIAAFAYARRAGRGETSPTS